MVSKQRVMRHKLNTDVNLIFSEMSWFIQSFTKQKKKKKKLVLFTRVTSTLTLLSVMKSSLLVAVLGGFCTCSFLRRNAQSLFSISQRFVVQDANRPAGCHHCSL